MPRGGYQKPSKPAASSGPGKFSRRTDGAVSAPDIDKEEGVQYGDRSKLEDAQRIAKAATGAGARVNPAEQRRPSGMVPDRSGLPSFLTSGEDTAPDEPTTHGLAAGPGAGPEALMASAPTDDAREIVLEFIASNYGNEVARQMLAQIRAERNASMQMSVPLPSSPMSSGLPAEEEAGAVPEDPSAGLAASDIA